MSNFDIDKILQLTQSITAMKTAGIDVPQSMMDSLNAMMQQAAGGGQVAVPEEKEEVKQETKKDYKVLQKKDLSCITDKEDFFNGDLYQTLYGNLYSSYPGNSNVAHADISTVEYMLSEKAKEIGKTELQKLFKRKCTEKKAELKAENEQKKADAEKAARDREAAELEEKRKLGHKTEFKNLPEWCTGNKYVGEDWICNDEEGIYKLEETGRTVKKIDACGRAFMVNRLLDPIDGGDGIDRVEIAYDSERGWQHRVVTRDMLVNQTEAIKLTKFSVDITSDMARPFTNYMASMLRESSRRNAIPSIPSSRKLAIMKDKKIILPFRSDDFVFEREADFPGLLAAVTPNETDAGYNEEEYLNAYRAMRKRNLPGFNLMTAAILSSPVVCMTNANGWVFNMHGPTGCGKSFLLSIGATLFADYHHENGSGYVKTPLMTNTAAETMCDTLHCYPLIIDDYNLLPDQKERDKFNKNIMLFSNGLGKERATKTLALVKPGFWKLMTFIAAEQSIREAAKQGGVSNRLFEITLDDRCPVSKEEIDNIMVPFNNTHGFAGIRFIEILNQMGVDAIREMVTEYAKKITKKMKEKGLDKTNKQIDIAAILLATDEIAKNELFQDDVQLDVDEVIKWMADNDEVKQESRFYNTIIDRIYANPRKFEGLGAKTETDIVGDFWGVYKPDVVTRMVKNESGQMEAKTECVNTIAFIPRELNKIALEEGASVDAFKNYLQREGLLIADAGQNRTTKINSMIQSRRIRVVRFIIPDDELKPENVGQQNGGSKTVSFQRAADDVNGRRQQYQVTELAQGEIPFDTVG